MILLYYLKFMLQLCFFRVFCDLMSMMVAINSEACRIYDTICPYKYNCDRRRITFISSLDTSQWDVQTSVYEETLFLVNFSQKGVILISRNESFIASTVRCYTMSCRVRLTAVDVPRRGGWVEP